MFHLFHCAYVFITFPSSSTSFCEPTLTGKERVLCVGRIAAEFLSCTAMSVSHPGWWMKRTSSSGGWKCPHIGSQRGLKKQRTMPLR